MILSGGVSGMHWCASVGTRYQLRGGHILNRDTRNATVIITIVLVSILCPIYCLVSKAEAYYVISRSSYASFYWHLLS